MNVAFLPHLRIRSTPQKNSLIGILALFALQICLSITPLMPWLHAAEGDALCTSNGWVYQPAPAEIAAALNRDTQSSHCNVCLASLQPLPVLTPIVTHPTYLLASLPVQKTVIYERDPRFWWPLVRAPPATVSG